VCAHNLNRLILLVLAPIVLCRAAPGQQPTESTDQVTATVAYPNNSQGLVTLLNDALMAARNNDRDRVQSMIRDMVIPNYENWFTTTFGQEKGESWAEPYGKLLQKNQKDFGELLFQLSHMEGQFSVHQFDTTKRYDTLKGQLDEYLADWINPGAPESERVTHIADFYFIDGRFRWNSNVEYFPFQKPTKRSIVPAKLVKKVPPEYPAEARDHGIEGTVKLQIIVRKDGSVTVQNVLGGDPALSPAATEAVRQWRYQPALLDGQQIEMQTTVEVNFALKP